MLWDCISSKDPSKYSYKTFLLVSVVSLANMTRSFDTTALEEKSVIQSLACDRLVKYQHFYATMGQKWSYFKGFINWFELSFFQGFMVF